MFPKRIAAIVLLGLVLRAAAWWLVHPTPPVLDERDYEKRAIKFAAGEPVVDESGRPPLSIWLYGAAYRVFGDRPDVARAVNVPFSVAFPWLLFLLGRRYAGERAGTVAAALAAVCPDFVFYGASLYSEAIYFVLSYAGLLLVLRERERERPGPWLLVAAGLLMGLAALTRDIGALVTAGVAAWIVLQHGLRSRRGWTAAAILAGAAALPIIPWSVRQNAQHDIFILITSNDVLNLYVGNIPQPSPDRPRPDRPAIGINLFEYQKLGETVDERAPKVRAAFRQHLAEEMPWWPFRKAAEMIPRTLTPNSLVTSRLMARPVGGGWSAKHAYVFPTDDPRLDALRDPIAWGNVALWAVVLVGGTAGLVLASGRSLGLLFAIYIAVHVAPLIVAYGTSRYRLPFVPLLMLGLAALLVNGRSAWNGAGPVRRGAAVAAAVLAGWACGSLWWTLETPQWG